MRIWISSKFNDKDHADRVLEIGDKIMESGNDPERCTLKNDRKIMIDHCLAKLKNCDILYLCSDYNLSAEAILEYNYAKQVGMPVYVESTKTWENLPF